VFSLDVVEVGLRLRQVVELEVQEVVPAAHAPHQLTRLASRLAGVVGLAAGFEEAVIALFAAGGLPVRAIVDALDFAVARGDLHESPHHMHSRFIGCLKRNHCSRLLRSGSRSRLTESPVTALACRYGVRYFHHCQRPGLAVQSQDEGASRCFLIPLDLEQDAEEGGGVCPLRQTEPYVDGSVLAVIVQSPDGHKEWAARTAVVLVAR
jgi:hypothetical protein